MKDVNHETNCEDPLCNGRKEAEYWFDGGQISCHLSNDKNDVEHWCKCG